MPTKLITRSRFLSTTGRTTQSGSKVKGQSSSLHLESVCASVLLICNQLDEDKCSPGCGVTTSHTWNTDADAAAEPRRDAAWRFQAGGGASAGRGPSSEVSVISWEDKKRRDRVKALPLKVAHQQDDQSESEVKRPQQKLLHSRQLHSHTRMYGNIVFTQVGVQA